MKSGRWILTLLLCTLLTGSLAGYKILEIRSAIAFAESLPEYSETVQTARARAVTHQPAIQVMGEVVQPGHLTLRNELSGRIVAIRAKPSEPVRQGQVLLQQDTSEERAKINSAKARLELAQLEYQRLSKLRKSNSASQAELDKATVQLQVIESELEVLNVAISKKTLKAPFDGVMGIHQLEQGSYLQPNTDIASFVGDSSWSWVEFSVPQFYALLEYGTTVVVQLAGSPFAGIKAEVIARDPVVSPGTRTHKYRAGFSTAENSHAYNHFAHNSSVLVTLPDGKPQAVIAVPLEAVQYDETGAFVYLLHPDNKAGGFRAERRRVTVDTHDNNRVMITEGLQEGEILAADGAFKLKPGLLVYPDKNDNSQTVSGI
ncbi:efflux RND transporter periplasmic adaptor subunit [Endozoicomonas lisbonensis]|uniref:Membrane fusion protein (Multidrug efflux system) n=1 Tax=Endozoicomonas lisbonensis TaxID=3120522 RepID=A0ABV2SJ20_9GAMM